jgi:hypothetical protein
MWRTRSCVQHRRSYRPSEGRSVRNIYTMGESPFKFVNGVSHLLVLEAMAVSRAQPDPYCPERLLMLPRSRFSQILGTRFSVYRGRAHVEHALACS